MNTYMQITDASTFIYIVSINQKVKTTMDKNTHWHTAMQSKCMHSDARTHARTHTHTHTHTHAHTHSLQGCDAAVSEQHLAA